MTDSKIKPGYIERAEPAYCVDKPDGHLWQWDAYTTALEIATRNSAKWVIDLGCGSGEKLELLFGNFKRIGLDYGENLKRCVANYPGSEWGTIDLENGRFFPPSMDAVIIFADVIEHLKNPEPLLIRLAELAPLVKGIVISTPDRDLTHGVGHNGPPPNLGHVREWNESELVSYLAWIGFPIRTVGHIPCKKDDERRITIMVTA